MIKSPAGENVLALPHGKIEKHMRLRIKYMNPSALKRNKNVIDQARSFPERHRSMGFATLPDDLMDIAYNLIKERLEEL